MLESPPSPPADLAARLDELQQMAAARNGKPGYARNYQALQAEIARLQQAIADNQSTPP